MAAQETAKKTRKNSKARRAKKTVEGRKVEEKGRQEGGAAATVAESGSFIERTKRYLQSVLAESKRVTWPTKAELMAGTVVTMFTLLMFASYLGLMDYFFGRILQ